MHHAPGEVSSHSHHTTLILNTMLHAKQMMQIMLCRTGMEPPCQPLSCVLCSSSTPFQGKLPGLRATCSPQSAVHVSISTSTRSRCQARGKRYELPKAAYGPFFLETRLLSTRFVFMTDHSLFHPYPARSLNPDARSYVSITGSPILEGAVS